jgi:hypothetical protein
MHEAGHALVCWLVDVAVVTVTIQWSGTSHGALVHEGSPPPESLLLILLAGDAAVARAGRLGLLEEAAEQKPRDHAGVEAEDERRGVGVTSDAENIEAVLEQLYPGDPSAQERASYGRASGSTRPSGGTGHRSISSRPLCSARQPSVATRCVRSSRRSPA